MHPRTPLLLLTIALPFTGCTCEWHTSTSKSWGTNSGGEQVTIVQENPDQIAREREARIAREREWERERERERARHPVVINQGGRTGTGSVPHAPAIGQPVPPPSQPVTGTGTVSGGSFGGGVGTPVAQPSTPAVPQTPPGAATPAPSAPAPSTPAPPPPAPPPPLAPPSDNYVAPREINKPVGGPSKAGSAQDSDAANKSKPTTRTGRGRQ